MIVASLHAENLLRWRTLSLADLPGEGVIGISGDNETGKTAIGEILCFALFGRTYAVGPEALGQLVRWGTGRGAVSLVFTRADQPYEVSRQVDTQGLQSARLTRAGGGEPLARGADAVDAHLRRLLGFGFEEYLETFYLAQREITTPQPHSPAVRRMAGVAPLLRCAEELAAEAAADAEAARTLEERIADITEERGGLREHQVPAEAAREELVRTTEGERAAGEVLDGLARAVEGYAEAGPVQRIHGVRRGIAGLLSVLALLAVLIVGGVWAMLRFRPELWPIPSVRRALEAAAVPLGLPLEALVVYLLVALIGTLLLVWLWRLALDVGTRRRLSRARKVADWLQRADELEVGPGAPPRVLPDLLEGGEVSLEGHVLLDRPDSERRARLGRRVLSLEASAAEVRSALDHERAWIERLREELSARRKTLAARLEAARASRDRLKALDLELVEAGKRLTELRAAAETGALARDLLGGAARSRAEAFAEQVRGGVARSLPRLTGGVYEHLELDPDLAVRVFSAGKRAFLDPAEISTGTQRQVMLALRLALADELATRVLRDRQFAFLDEPFAYFDETRMAGALAALSQAGEGVVQHFVVAQRFPPEAGLVLEIRCGEHPDSLVVPAAAAAGNG